MEKPSFKLVGAPCGHHGQYTFYKAIKLTTKRERIVAIGDFFFVRIWQDSELVSIGELQLLWTDRVSDQTLVSLRLYFLPENTPDGRSLHGEDEVLAISEKVVLKAEDLLSWVSEGDDWRWGLKAVWRGACAPPSEVNHTEPLHHTKLDFSDVDKEKNAIAVEQDAPGVVVFSYPRYCRYRALVSRLEGTQGSWLRDSLVAALGGYAAPTTRTRILYCKDTFDYPDLEGHEFVCNHLAPKLKGRPRGRRRRPPRSRTQSPDSRSSDGQDGPEEKTTPRRISLRNGPDKSSDDEDKDRKDIKDYKEVNLASHSPEDEAFLMQLHQFHRERNEEFLAPTLKHLSLRALYSRVTSRGGYDAVCRHKLWRVLFAEHPSHTKRHYERYLLQYENHIRNGRRNGMCEQQEIPTIDVADSPDTRHHTPKRDIVDSETGEIKEEINMISKPAEELNREFLDSLPKEEKPAKIALIPVEKLIKNWGQVEREEKSGVSPEVCYSQDSSTSAHNGHATALLDQRARPTPAGRSSLRAVRVKPNRPAANTTPSSVSTSSSGSSTWSRSPPAGGGGGGGGGGVAHNFGIHHPPPQHPPPPPPQDDDIQEVPYKPKTPEIIDLDEYPESPQSVKKKKLDILKEGGLEVTPLPTPSWPPVLPTPITPILTPNPMLLNPVVQHQIMSNAQLFQMYNVVPNFPNGTLPPKVIQATSIFGTTSPEKTVYGNPKDPFMPPPHVIHGVPLKPQKSVQIPSTPPQDILDLTCKLTTKSTETTQKPTVEIVRVPTTPSPSKTSPQNLSKNYSIIDGKAVVGSNLEITLVNKNNPKIQSHPRPTQKRSSNGKFIPKTPEKEKTPPRKNPITIPNYPVPEPSSTQPLQQVSNQKESKPNMGFLDPYMALYNFAGQMDPRQLAAYRDLMTSQMKGYSNLLNMGMHPTTKN